MTSLQALQKIYGFKLDCNHEWGKESVCFHNSIEIMKYEDFIKLPMDDKEQLHVSKVVIGCLKCGQPFNS